MHRIKSFRDSISPLMFLALMGIAFVASSEDRRSHSEALAQAPQTEHVLDLQATPDLSANSELAVWQINNIVGEVTVTVSRKILRGFAAEPELARSF